MTDLRSANIHITGIVQGVGFRPFVYGLAIRLGIKGWVRNTSAGVDIQMDGTADSIDSFVSSLKSELPPLARIDSIEVSFGEPQGFGGFEIINSEVLAGAFQPISPDVSICPDCLRELLDPSDRRFRYPFINCTNCGPRFTIINDIPYDRSNTTMAPFEMCPDCAAEYANPLDRRFHAQPVACPVCGPQIWLEEVDGRRIAERDDAILATQKLLASGKIVAIKGLGGFHLACDALNIEAVTELRQRKLRVDKPFALMMPDLAMVAEHCIISEAERALLESRQRPIILLQRKPGTPIAEEVAPKQSSIGVMLPYTPIHYLLFVPERSSRRGPGEHLHRRHLSRRLLSEPEGHSRQRGPGGGCRRRGAGAHRQGAHRAGAEHGLYPRGDCSGCKSCIPLCPYTAISLLADKKKAVINEALCKGCGTCVAACPSGSIVQNLFEDAEIFSEIDGLLAPTAV